MGLKIWNSGALQRINFKFWDCKDYTENNKKKITARSWTFLQKYVLKDHKRGNTHQDSQINIEVKDDTPHCIYSS